MGISTAFAALLVGARESGARFGDVATIGRQSLTVPREELEALARRLGLAPGLAPEFARDGYAEDFLERHLGACSVTSFDASDYQHADCVHDFNQPLPEEQHRRFDSLIDGGALEHIFDVRQALANYLQLVRLGGRVFIATPANNQCGHGFYQFSPELFYRVFAAENGFEVERLCLIETPFFSVEVSRQQSCFHAADPAEVGKRMRLMGRRPLSVFVQARRVDEREPFSSSPLQSDYAGDKWERKREPEATAERPPFRYLTRWQELHRRLRERRSKSLRNRKFFRPFEP